MKSLGTVTSDTNTELQRIMKFPEKSIEDINEVIQRGQYRVILQRLMEWLSDVEMTDECYDHVLSKLMEFAKEGHVIVMECVSNFTDLVPEVNNEIKKDDAAYEELLKETTLDAAKCVINSSDCPNTVSGHFKQELSKVIDKIKSFANKLEKAAEEARPCVDKEFITMLKKVNTLVENTECLSSS